MQAGSAQAPFGRPARDEGAGRVPVFVVTGFLGAGKTTLIRSLLDTPDGAGTAVVVNEFGEIGIDQDLLRSSTEATVLLGNGCVCCSMRSDLQETLRQLWIERSRGAIPAFRRVVVETTGLADPGPILQTFLTDRALGAEFYLRKLICVAALPALEETLADMPEAGRQLALADCVVTTKADLAAPDEAESAIEAIRSVNPHAQLLSAAHGELAPELFLASALPARRSGFRAESTDGHLGQITSFAITLKEPVEWQAFAAALDLIRKLRGADLLRLKGLVDVQGRPGPVVIQIVGHFAHPPVELTAWPEGERSSRLVAITRGIAQSDLLSLLEAVHRLGVR